MASSFLINSSYSVFLIALFFASSLGLVKSTGVFSNLPIPGLCTLLFKLLTSVGIFSNLSTFDFILAKSTVFYQNLMYQHLLRFLSRILLYN